MHMNDSTITSGDHMPFWLENIEQKTYETVSHDIQSDVLIIGGGIAGITTAYCLTKEGYDVVLVED